jgi:hypothetical protein
MLHSWRNCRLILATKIGPVLAARVIPLAVDSRSLVNEIRSGFSFYSLHLFRTNCLFVALKIFAEVKGSETGDPTGAGADGSGADRACVTHVSVPAKYESSINCGPVLHSCRQETWSSVSTRVAKARPLSFASGSITLHVARGLTDRQDSMWAAQLLRF